ncbi:PAS domain-containing methyl-accepting chemotaxis protein [Rhodanobacter sp. AS-Z3]|uniref:methyl-accepting chemotaxis protein n=1 Tax=Rhodanobacter sp. AS-Z3 TaxID=3031330 RepID=UPI002478828A|nr:PAS domain-containing methyl-accepting chemotaxis protein [Rhodanobacter sp. AS-Z3]WEN16094.1 PAS domain-containing methyl-accepting chemotaxis protein [Rhodanobacter sp. AS-Z3]
MSRSIRLHRVDQGQQASFAKGSPAPPFKQETNWDEHMTFSDGLDRLRKFVGPAWARCLRGFVWLGNRKWVQRIGQLKWVQRFAELGVVKQIKARLNPQKDAPTIHDFTSEMQALNKVQAIIEFELDGTIVDANENFLKLMGYSHDEVVGKHHGMFVADAARKSEKYKAFWKQLGEGVAQSGIYKRLGKDKREVWIQGSYSPLLDARGRPCKVIQHAADVTEQRLKMADMEGRLAAIDRAQAVITFDLDGNILDANENFLATVGYTRNELVGRHHRMLVSPQERDSEAYRQFWAHLHDGEYHAGLFRRIRKDGKEAWIQASYNPIFDMSGRPFKVVKYATDVTRQTQASHQLQQSLGSLAQTVPAIAGKAKDANHVAGEAASSADRGGSLVKDLVSTIDEVNKRAQDMVEIITLIDSIGFQTNILALNAAVEAARAGEQGRGFAVVAQEVRALAQRSAQSSRDIRELVHATINTLADGSKRAHQTGEAMLAIIGSTTQATERIREIAAEADAQSHSIRQVEHAIAQLQATGTKA